MIYLDSSALLKLLFEEAESSALERWMTEQSATPKVSSEVAKVEVLRASRRLDADMVPAAGTLLYQLDMVPLTGGIVEDAAHVGAPSLRTLDALHLASALSLGADLSSFVTYDSRLRAAAAAEGLVTLHPGA